MGAVPCNVYYVDGRAKEEGLIKRDQWSSEKSIGGSTVGSDDDISEVSTNLQVLLSVFDEGKNSLLIGCYFCDWGLTVL
jgi:hypothetical protein